MVLLVLRPEPQASDMVAALASRGVAALAEPMLSIEAADDPVARIRAADPRAEALIFTSRQTVAILKGAAGIEQLRGLPVIAVGGGTAHDARVAGFADVRSADGNADDLVDLVARSGFRRLVHAGGHDKAGDVAGRLGELGVSVAEAEIYRAEPRDWLAPNVADAFAEGRIDGLIVASRRSSQAFVNLVESMDLTRRLTGLRVAALSEAAAAPFAGRVARVVVATSPTGPALIEASIALVTGPVDTVSDFVPPGGGEEQAEGASSMASDNSRDGAKAGKRQRPQAPVIDIEATVVAATEAGPAATAEPAAEPRPEPQSEPAATVTAEPASEAASPLTESVGPTADAAADATTAPADEAPAAALPPRVDRPSRLKSLLPTLAAAALGSAITVAILLLVLPQQSAAPEDAIDVTALEARLSEIANRLSSAETLATAGADRIAALEAAKPAAVDLTPLESRLADLAARLDKVEAGLAAAASAPGVDPGALSALEGRLAEVAASAEALKGADGALAARVAAAEERLSRAPERGEIAALSLALTSLSGKIDSGLPFAADLDVVAAVAPDLPELADLKPVAATGVSNRDKLIAGLPVEAMLAHRPVTASGDWVDGLVEGAKSLVNYRETGDAAADPVSAAIEEIRAALVRGDAAAAKTAAATLPDWARAPADAWLAELDARVRADAAIKALTARIVDRLSASAGN